MLREYLSPTTTSDLWKVKENFKVRTLSQKQLGVTGDLRRSGVVLLDGERGRKKNNYFLMTLLIYIL